MREHDTDPYESWRKEVRRDRQAAVGGMIVVGTFLALLGLVVFGGLILLVVTIWGAILR